MTVYRSITACNIEATYNVITQVLTLAARGMTGSATHGINFKMIAISSGLKFVLGAETGLDDCSNIPYQISESFKVQLPANTLLSEAITIITQNEPEGGLVPIYFVGMFQESELLPIAAEAFTPRGTTPTKRKLVNKSKNTRLNESFGIKTSAWVAEYAFA